ncbi:MAG: hypothetical protein JWM16_4148 [Verrucomicrobiales bacterium]|nr:hypothetical protein [Verrucomicrobiales bacterium]
MNTEDSDRIQPDTTSPNRNRWMKMDPTGSEYEALLRQTIARPVWGLEDVAIYLRKTVAGAKIWMYRQGVKKFPGDRSKTCREWVDSGLRRKPLNHENRTDGAAPE